MCDASNSCAQSCVRLSGVESCGCLPGYKLASNGMNCTSRFSKVVEKQLCTLGTDAVFNGICIVIIISWSHYFTEIFWNAWYFIYEAPTVLHVNKSCPQPSTDINECQEDPCEQICTDLERGYECSCREGYQLLPGGRCTGEGVLFNNNLITTSIINSMCIQVWCYPEVWMM